MPTPRYHTCPVYSEYNAAGDWILVLVLAETDAVCSMHSSGRIYSEYSTGSRSLRGMYYECTMYSEFGVQQYCGTDEQTET